MSYQELYDLNRECDVENSAVAIARMTMSTISIDLAIRASKQTSFHESVRLAIFLLEIAETYADALTSEIIVA